MISFSGELVGNEHLRMVAGQLSVWAATAGMGAGLVLEDLKRHEKSKKAEDQAAPFTTHSYSYQKIVEMLDPEDVRIKGIEVKKQEKQDQDFDEWMSESRIRENIEMINLLVHAMHVVESIRDDVGVLSDTDSILATKPCHDASKIDIKDDESIVRRLD